MELQANEESPPRVERARDRVLRGALEGAIIGFVALGLARLVTVAWRHDLATGLRVAIPSAVVGTLAGAYIVAVGRGIAASAVGALLGAVVGLFLFYGLAHRLFGFYWVTEVTPEGAIMRVGYPLGLYVGGPLGVLVGALLGAWVERVIRKRLL